MSCSDVQLIAVTGPLWFAVLAALLVVTVSFGMALGALLFRSTPVLTERKAS